MVKLPLIAAPQLGTCAFSGRLWAARHTREEAGPLGAQPPASAARASRLQGRRRFHRLDHPGGAQDELRPRARRAAGAAYMHMHMRLSKYVALHGHGFHVHDICVQARPRTAAASAT